jgi:hypothetical protein
VKLLEKYPLQISLKCQCDSCGIEERKREGDGEGDFWVVNIMSGRKKKEGEGRGERER